MIRAGQGPGSLACLATLLALGLAGAAAGSALAQDINPRRGFGVRVTEPKANELVVGSVTIRAEVTARRPEDVERVDFIVDDRLVLADSEPPYQVVFDFGKRTGTRVIRVVAHHREGATASDFILTRATDLQFVVNVQRVVLDVSVRDGQHRLVRNLSAADFEVVEEGRPQKVATVSPEKRPLLVGVVLDSSGSMRERMKEAQEAACGFVDALEPQDRAFVVDFDEQVTLVEEVSSDRALLCKAIRSTSAVGGTALYDAIHASYRVLRGTTAERRALVLLSDGDDTESRVKFPELLREAQLNDVAVYVIGLDVGSMSEARRSLAELAEQTGGRSFFVKKAEELLGIYTEIADELRTLYQVVYSSDNQKFDGRFVPVSVRVRNGKDFDVRHRTGYRAVEP